MDINYTFKQEKALSRAFFASGSLAYELLAGTMYENDESLGDHYVIRNQGKSVYIGTDKDDALMNFNAMTFTMKKEWTNA